MGLRWDSEWHQWHGTTTADRVKDLREQLGLEVRCFGALDQPPRRPSPPRPPAPGATPVCTEPSVRNPAPRPPTARERTSSHGLRSRMPGKARRSFPTPTRRFSLLEITSGLPDDSREADEKQAERRLRDLRGRVKAARAVVATTPGLADTLQRDRRKTARFYVRFGITEDQFRHGVPETGTREKRVITAMIAWDGFGAR